jgi:hypothetical protein
MGLDHEMGLEKINQGEERKDRPTYEQAIWSLFVLVSRKLQISSASIKASVSSLLDYNIFWDGSSQHEFLESINSSTDQITKLIMLVTLTSRAQAGSLILKPEPHILQEIVSVSVDQIKKSYSTFMLDLKLSSESRTVLVDYEYLLLALKLVFEILIDYGIQPNKFTLSVQDGGQFCNLDLIGESTFMKSFEFVESDRMIDLLIDDSISPENRLKCIVFYQIILRQGFSMKFIEHSKLTSGLRILIPYANTNETSQSR